MFVVIQITETGEEFVKFSGTEDECEQWLDENAPNFGEEQQFCVEKNDERFLF